MPDIPIYGPGRTPIKLQVNGQQYFVAVLPIQTLAEILRNELGLTGTKIVCAMGNCGACTVLHDGKPVYSCLTLAIDCQDRAITTIEGLAHDGVLSPVQQAFIAEDAFQCAYCTSGQVLTMTAFLAEHPDADADAIRHAVAGNLCRCGAYPKIVKAGLRASKALRQSVTGD